VDVNAVARAALIIAKQAEDDGDYHECLRALASGPDTWWWASQLNEEMGGAVWRTQRSCMRRLRAQADKAVRAKDYSSAIELLAPVVEHIEEGNFNTVTIDGGWLLNDLAFAYQRDHQYVACLQLIGSLSLELGDGDADRLFKAVDHNLSGCRKRLDAEYAIKSGGCRISIDGAIATVAAPRALMPEGAAAACVALVPGKRPPTAKEDEYAPACPVVALIWRGASGAVEREELPTAGPDAPHQRSSDPLNEVDFCTGLSSIEVGTKDGKSLVRVSGAPDEHCRGHQCLHIGSVDVFYEWNGEVLTPALDVTY
jgi:hypothetical protein